MPVKVRHASRAVIAFVPALLVIAASALAFYKVQYLGYNLDAVIQSESYYLETVMEFDGHGSPVEISMALPQNLPHQTISDEAFSSDDLRFVVETQSGNRRGIWRTESAVNRQHISYTATVMTKSQKFHIDSTLQTSQPIAGAIAADLMPDSMIQSESPAIVLLADSLRLSADSTILYNAAVMFSFVTNGLKYMPYSGTTDALTAYRLAEASCGGKARLMVALARNIGIPGRLVGGKILSSGQSTATHIWLELYIYGIWVPFCPTNNYFAEIPSNYLILYYGDEPFVTHTKDINFKYYFNLKKRLVSTTAGFAQFKKHPLDILNIWASFKRVAISLELLKIIIMLPLGVLAVVIFRNLVGLETFGTFMPALIAIGFRDTGLMNGILLFGVIILFGALIRKFLNQLQLLHTPRLAIILSSVVMFILGLTALGVSLGFLNLARVALFPMVILTLTVERFSVISEESGFRHAIRISALTLLVASCAYLLMSWRLLQAVVISFPEIILLVIAVHIYIGRYSGFRLVEFLRFRHLLVRT